MYFDNEVEDQRFTGGFGVGVSVAKLLATSGRRLHLEVWKPTGDMFVIVERAEFCPPGDATQCYSSTLPSGDAVTRVESRLSWPAGTHAIPGLNCDPVTARLLGPAR